ncbi:MAG: class I SAM-dependent methyltransferase [Endomicrobium sp.]|jgi:hypothetical protein|nr:class I SAM-dependent methyltransferase [Endomicrobium sp.]
MSISNLKNKNYCDIYKEHTGFVSDKWMHYFFIYDLLFYKFIAENKPVTLLEIGVQNGGSLEIWGKYLPDNSKIYGVDITPDCCKLKFGKNIRFHLGSASDPKFMNDVFKDINFDIILDDGSHICNDVVKTFKNMFPKLKNGGVYVVEDLHTSYWGYYGGGLFKKSSSVEFFKNLIDSLNSDYFKHGKRDMVRNFFYKKHIKFLEEYNRHIQSIQFFDSVCAIYKYNNLKTVPFQTVKTGEIENVAKMPNSKKHIKSQEKELNAVKNLFL